ncbi:hypothetical protein E1B28_002905 [Marasmius oreades]|uniref:Uncharacterized protein n=1 Tax=Marasmius oreades TaxID=181124 RepID=A0A9P7UMV6_9AGAR|nr:uncharacterized protein E1B28_002905 [Marasmius oreades]KAG7085339.1 hypothetical protein E1B28_002905 [Marasmius oreades]
MTGEYRQMISGLVHKANALAHDALRGRRGNALLMFPVIQQSISKLRSKLLISRTHHNVTSPSTHNGECSNPIWHAIWMVDDIVGLLDHVERASKEVVGDISDSSARDRTIKKTARGFCAITIQEVYDRIRLFDPTIQHPFTVNPSPVWSFLGNHATASSESSASGSGNGISRAEISDWRDNISVVSNDGSSQ